MGKRKQVALAILTDVTGGASRSPGAHMAIASDGRYCGYVSGDVLKPPWPSSDQRDSKRDVIELSLSVSTLPFLILYFLAEAA